MRMTTTRDYPMTATYHSWEPTTVVGEVTYRQYSAGEDVKCRIAVSPVGSLILTTEEKLQSFGIITQMKDSAGTVFMDDTWYQIQRVIPLFDAGAYITGYRHQLAILAPELVNQPIDPPVDYPGIDQQR